LQINNYYERMLPIYASTNKIMYSFIQTKCTITAKLKLNTTDDGKHA